LMDMVEAFRRFSAGAPAPSMGFLLPVIVLMGGS
jgi:hypothetical protein